MHADIVVLPGDGIGPEVTAAAVEVLRAIARRYNHQFRFDEKLIGGAAIDATGTPLPADTLDAAQAADAILLGAVGGPKWSDPNAKVRPEQGLLAIRKALGLFANLRPVKPHVAGLGASPIKPHLLQGVDLIVVRELTGGIRRQGRRRVIQRALGAFWACDRQASRRQFGESLRRGDFVDQVQVDVQHRRCGIGFRRDQMRVPQLVEQCLRNHHAASTRGCD